MIVRAVIWANPIIIPITAFDMTNWHWFTFDLVTPTILDLLLMLWFRF